jgi:hypothetical protein
MLLCGAASPPAAAGERSPVMKHSLTHLPPGPVEALVERLSRPREPARHEERSSALRPSMAERLETALWRWRQRELERALEGATDAADLEARLRRVEWRTLYRYY